jgi:hypothetical protein
MNTFNPNSKKQHKDKIFISQKKTIFLYLEKNVATASMVSFATGIAHKNITRYKADLQKVGKLWEVKKEVCNHTGYKAWFITCNPEFAPNHSKQITLF